MAYNAAAAVAPRDPALASVSAAAAAAAPQPPPPQIVHPREWAIPSYLAQSRFSSSFQVGGPPESAGGSAGQSAPLASGSGTSSSSSTYLDKLQARLDASTSTSSSSSSVGRKKQRIHLPSKLDPKQCCKRLHIISDTRVQFLPERDEQGRESA